MPIEEKFHFITYKYWDAPIQLHNAISSTHGQPHHQMMPWK